MMPRTSTWLRATALLGLLFGGPLLAPAQAAPLVEVQREAVPTRIENVQIFDAPNGELEGPYDVLLQNGRIVALLEPGSNRAGAERVVDGEGATLLPGLIDLHVHLEGATAWPGRPPLPRPRHNMQALLRAGITTALDLSAPPERIRRWDRRVVSGRWAGPRIYGSGRPFTAKDGHPRSSVRAMYPSLLVDWASRNVALEVTTPDDVDRALSSEGPRTVFKVVLDAIPRGTPELSPEALLRLRDLSRDLSVPLVAHVGRPEDVDRALTAQVDALAHIPYAGALRPEQISRIAEQDMPVIATMAVWEAVDDLARGTRTLEPLERAILGPSGVRAAEQADPDAAPEAMQAWAQELVAHREDRLSNAVRLREAGVPLLVGSDGPNMALVAGAATHQELRLLERAGFSPAEVLSAATWHNSRFLSRYAPFGAVKPGWAADLLLVDGDPTDSLDALEDIRGVWTRGRWVELLAHPP